MADLSQRDREILRLRFGFETGEVETLEKVAKRYGITRERVRQLELQAVRDSGHSKSSVGTARTPFATARRPSRAGPPASVCAPKTSVRGSSMAEQAAVNR